MRMTCSDQDLVLAANSGDAHAFALLLDRHYDRLFAFCFRLTGAKAEAEDLTQDICAGLPSKLNQFQGRSQFTTWLYRIAVNAAHDRRRRQLSHSRAATGWGNWEVNRTAAAADEAQRHLWLQTAMATLSEDLRDTLACILDDLTHAQTAEILGISEGTVSWRVSKAKKALREFKEKESQP